MYVQHSIEAWSCNHCCSGKTLSITYSESCSLTYAACNVNRPYCDLVPAQLYDILPYYLINGMIFGKKKLLNMKCLFWFSLQRLSEVFLILRTIQRHIIINLHRFSCKVPIFLPDFNEKILKKCRYQILWKFVKSEPRCSIIQTDKHTVMTKLILAFRDFSNAHHKDSGIGFQPLIMCVVTLLSDLSRALRHSLHVTGSYVFYQ
jgi:hypothetical protein